MSSDALLGSIPPEWRMTVFAECLDSWCDEVSSLFDAYGYYIKPYFAWLHMCSPEATRIVLLDGRLSNTYQANHHKKPKIPHFDLHSEESTHDRVVATQMWYDVESNTDESYATDPSADAMSFARYYSSIGCTTAPQYCTLPSETEEPLPLAWGHYGIIAWSWVPPVLPPEASSEDRQLLDVLWTMLTDSLFQMDTQRCLLWLAFHTSKYRDDIEGLFRRWRPVKDAFYNIRSTKDNVYVVISSFLQMYNQKAPCFLRVANANNKKK
jgi:hypothetical protein